MAAGRPSGYKENYGPLISELMAEGLSLTAAAAEIGFHRDTVYDWEKKYPEFSDNIKLARGKRQLFLERRLLTANEGPKVTSTIFALPDIYEPTTVEFYPYRIVPKNHDVRVRAISDAATAPVFSELSGYLAAILPS